MAPSAVVVGPGVADGRGLATADAFGPHAAMSTAIMARPVARTGRPIAAMPEPSPVERRSRLEVSLQ